jgi:hypothetical protein
MRKMVMREAAVYALLLVTCALLMHPDLLSDPADRYAMMEGRENYFHPLFYTALIYLIVLIFRGVIGMIARLFSHSAPSE